MISSKCYEVQRPPEGQPVHSSPNLPEGRTLIFYWYTLSKGENVSKKVRLGARVALGLGIGLFIGAVFGALAILVVGSMPLFAISVIGGMGIGGSIGMGIEMIGVRTRQSTT